LTRRPGNPLSQKYLQLLGPGEVGVQTANGEDVPIKGVQQNSANAVSMVNIKVRNENFFAVLDTGSSDTWLATTGFKCLNKGNKRPVADRKCRFGPTYNKTSTFTQIPDQHFNTSFLGGTFLSGIMGTETVTLGNLTVDRQPLGFVNSAAWEAEGFSLGLIGLAFPSITNAYPAASGGKKEPTCRIPQYSRACIGEN
jgi:hypothetical protein